MLFGKNKLINNTNRPSKLYLKKCGMLRRYRIIRFLGRLMEMADCQIIRRQIVRLSEGRLSEGRRQIIRGQKADF
jgi:hypothetical protein